MKLSIHDNHRWLRTAFCLLTMLFAVVVSAGLHFAAESPTEIVECEEVEEAVTVRKIRHRKFDNIYQIADCSSSFSRHAIENVPARSSSERDNFNGIGTFLLT